MRLIPAIDLMDGCCVRLTKGDFGTRTIYSDDPASMAAEFESMGFQHLHLVDLDGARGGGFVHWHVLEAITAGTNLSVDVSGGLKTVEDVRRCYDLGAKQIVAGSLAVQDPEKVLGWVELFGADRFVLGADVKEGALATHGWTRTEGGISLHEHIERFASHGVEHVMCTDVERDGMLAGPSVELYRSLLQWKPSLRLIASGGIASVEDLVDLSAAGMEGAIIGKALYEHRITAAELRGRGLL